MKKLWEISISMGICSVESCNRTTDEFKKLMNGMCPAHYFRVRKYGDANKVHIPPTQCKIENCTLPFKRLYLGYCTTHYSRFAKHGNALYDNFAPKHGHGQSARNGVASPTYQTWKAMRMRCNNPKHEHYSYYGGRGIIVCERWKYFANFLEDMGERPENMTLDRKDSNGNYEPTNCRWVTSTEQANNRGGKFEKSS